MTDILLVDDDRKYTEDTADLLKHHGYRVRVANDLGTAMCEMQSYYPHSVIADKNIGGHRGVAPFLAYMQTEHPSVIVILSSNEDGAQAVRELYCHGFIPKHLPIGKFIERMDGILRNPGQNYN
jgi:DNA-binding response OmpR family regulator